MAAVSAQQQQHPHVPGGTGPSAPVDVFEGIDLNSALLIAQLQLEDAMAISAGAKGKSRIDAPVSDQEVALRIQQEELSSWKQGCEDASLARSIDSALNTDARVLEAYRLVEETAAADRRAALLLSRGSAIPRPTDAQRRVGDDKEFARLFKELATPEEHVEPTAVHIELALNWNQLLDSESSRSSAGAGPSTDRLRSGIKRVACISCGDKLSPSSVLKSRCAEGHHWCGTCLSDLIEVYLRDDSLHPLRCCQVPFTLPELSPYIKKKGLFAQFETKHNEYDVLAQDRVYCSTPTCSAFLGSAPILRAQNTRWWWRIFSLDSAISAACGACNAQTCVTCRKPGHVGDSCSQNEAVEQVRALAREAGWQTCPGCSTVVELHHGCNHMTCRCRAQFCYVCGVQWKQCDCPQWDEERLVVTAQVRAEVVMGGQAAREAQPEVYVQRVRQQVENLRLNHGCVQHSWRERGGGRCEECGNYLRQFLKMCRNCNLSVCKRCKLNRL